MFNNECKRNLPPWPANCFNADEVLEMLFADNSDDELSDIDEEDTQVLEKSIKENVNIGLYRHRYT